MNAETKVTKVEEGWYRAELVVENGLLTFIQKAYGTNEEEALKNLYDKHY